MSKKRGRRRNNTALAITTVLVAIALMFSSAFLAFNVFNGKTSNPSATTSSQIVSITDSSTQEEVPVSKTASASVSVTGDLLMHEPIISNAYNSADKSYNFDNVFTLLKSYTTKSDYSIANLETTLAGTENGRKYSGYPTFNCPDTIVDASQNAGFDMLLTSNNHSYDTSLFGFKRTLDVINNKKMDHIGTKLTEDDKDFIVKDINGIKIGMVCYTYETSGANSEKKSLNGINLATEATNLVKSFSYEKLDEFYDEVAEDLSAMKQRGAESTVIYIHWGIEYQVKENSTQRKIAQKLCDLGVNVIVGGHPHVVQPMDLLTSTDGQNKTVCIYSLGNAVSNQRKSRMNLKTGHTEDGLLFTMNFAKYSDGSVFLESVDALPLWVNLHSSSGKSVYQIVPLDKSVSDWKSAFSLGGNLQNAEDSYERTMKIIGEGLTKSNEYLQNVQTPDEK